MQKICSWLLPGLLLFAVSTPANALATRTWVSGTGSDANPCSRTAPCQTFAGAISKTAPHGEISVLDPGGYGGVTITKSISIVSEGSEGSILSCSVNGIVINAATTDVINIHGVLIEGCNNGINGIKNPAAGSVHIRKCLIRGFTTATSNAILVAPTAGNVKVVVSDCTMSKNKQGILVSPTAPGTARVLAERIVIDNTNGPAIRANSGATVRLNNSVIAGNNRSFLVAGTGEVISFGNNVVADNATNDPPSSTIPLQ